MRRPAAARRVLVTRPADDAEPLAAALAQRGCRVILEPLLQIVMLPDVTIDLAGVQALLLTSANGVRALAAQPSSRALPLWAVGEATARCARALGYTVAGVAAGDVDSLAAVVAQQLDPGNGALLHVAGTHRAGALAEVLAARGFATRRAVLYRADEALGLSPAVHRALAGGGIDDALFFSPRTAAAFVRLIDAADLARHCRPLVAYALSAAVAEPLAGLPWHRLRVATLPRQESLLALFDDGQNA